MTDLIVRENNLPTTPEDLSAFVLFGDKAVNILRAQIAALKKCGTAKDVVELQLKQAQTAAENVTIAKIKLGELLAALPKATKNNNLNGRASKENNQIEAPVDLVPNETVPKVKPKAEAIKELGISQKQSEQLQQMAKNPDAVHAAMAKARENDDVVSQSQILNEIKQTRRKEDIQRQVDEIEQQAVEKPDGLFDVIVIDPPWGYVREAHHGSFDANGRRCTNPYPEMTQAELKAIDLPAAENCVLFLWTTHKFIWDAKNLLDTWHFDYRCMLVWNKQQMGMGNLFRMQCEFCLVALKGKPTFNDVHNLRDIIKVEKIQQQASPKIKAALRTGDISISAAYEGVKAGATTADFSAAKYSVREEFSRFFCYPPVRAHSGIFRSGVTAFEKEKDLACAMR